jgi:hypothetical protein
VNEKKEKGKEEGAARREARRGFTKKAVGAALAAPAFVAARAGAQTTPKPPEATAPPKPEATPPQARQTQTPSPAAAWAEVARALYGERLTPEEFERLRRGLEGNVRSSEALRGAKLSNADEPDFTFEA